MKPLKLSCSDHQGADVLEQVSSGRVAALGQLYNDRIPGYMADFDRLASGVADAVNGQLSAGLDRNGAAPTVDLFTYDAALGAARTLAVNPLATDDLAAASAGFHATDGVLRRLFAADHGQHGRGPSSEE